MDRRCGAFPGMGIWFVMLWHLLIEAAEGLTDTEGRRVVAEAADLGLRGPWRVAASRGFLVEGALTHDDLVRAAQAVLADPVVERFAIHSCGPAATDSRSSGD